MGETIKLGDLARFADGTTGRIVSIEMFVGLYVLDVEGETFVAARHEFQPVKWEPPTVTATGLGVCAACSYQENAL